MTFGDFSPPSSPSLDQQRDALQKGLGRATQWAFGGQLDDGALLDACLRDQRFDVQVEQARGDWLWRMVRTVGATDRFRVPILHALYDLTDDRSASQLCKLARNYAQAGDEAFRTQLYKIVARKPLADSPWLGETEIVELDGEGAFVFAARVRGRRLVSGTWDWDDECFVESAVKRFGDGRVNRLLTDPADGAIRLFQRRWHQETTRKSERPPHPTHEARMRAIAVGEIIAAAQRDDPRYGLFRGWGMHAGPSDLGTVLEHLRAAREPSIIAKLLRVFSNRALPQFDARLIELCQHGDGEVRRWAFSALEKNAHPLVREFALAELKKGACEGCVVALFINNYQKGDERRIREAMEFPDDACELHWLLMDVIKMLEKNPEADCSQLGVIGYASTPCENCRFYAARLLVNQQVAPGWLTEECRSDSGKDCRELVEKATGSAPAN